MFNALWLIVGAGLCYLFLRLLANRKIRNPITPRPKPSKPTIVGYLGGPGRVCRHCHNVCEKILITTDGEYGCEKCFEK